MRRCESYDAVASGEAESGGDLKSNLFKYPILLYFSKCPDFTVFISKSPTFCFFDFLPMIGVVVASLYIYCIYKARTYICSRFTVNHIFVRFPCIPSFARVSL